MKRIYIRVINTRVIRVVSYVVNVCNFTKKQIVEPNKVIKQELIKAKMHGMHASDERLYISIEHGG